EEEKQLEIKGSWKSIHDYARDNDGKRLADAVEGRNGAILSSIDAQTDTGWSALHVAAMHKSALATASAIELRGDIFLQDCTGRSPLHDAAANNAVEVLSHLVAKAKRGNLQARDKLGNTPLHAAARAGAWDACRYLLAAGADSKVANARGHTP
ncbi:hypothetical protein GUITHDRAFT_55086, partial [Guillardia theta CCMP2712]